MTTYTVTFTTYDLNDHTYVVGNGVDINTFMEDLDNTELDIIPESVRVIPS